MALLLFNNLLKIYISKDNVYLLSGFYRSRLFLSGNTHIFFNVNAKKEESKCTQLNDKRISAAQIRVIGKSRRKC